MTKTEPPDWENFAGSGHDLLFAIGEEGDIIPAGCLLVFVPHETVNRSLLFAPVDMDMPNTLHSGHELIEVWLDDETYPEGFDSKAWRTYSIE